MSTSYYEDRLPKGQSPIETSNVKRLLICTYYLTDLDNPYSTIAVVTAPAGAGKSIAAGFCQQAVERRFSSALPATLKVKVMPRSTSGVLATNVLENLGEPVRGDNSAELTAAAARGIERNDTRLVIFDEGDRLNDDSFEVVRYLQDKTGCPILIIGLPRILSVIDLGVPGGGPALPGDGAGVAAERWELPAEAAGEVSDAFSLAPPEGRTAGEGHGSSRTVALLRASLPRCVPYPCPEWRSRSCSAPSG